MEETIIIDHGTSALRVGFSGEAAPRNVIPSLIGRPKFPKLLNLGNQMKELYVGDDAVEKRGILSLSHPIILGYICNFEDVEKMWHHMFFNELKIGIENKSILISEQPSNMPSYREKTISLLFESFGFPRAYLAISSVLQLYSAGGNMTGTVVESGEGITHITPVVQGKHVPEGVIKFGLSGNDITAYLAQILNQRGYNLNSTLGLEAVKKMKEIFSAIEIDEKKKDFEEKDQKFTMPDGTQIELNGGCPHPAEALFNPALVNLEYPGIQHHIVNSISRVSLNLHKELYSNIITAGGNTMFGNFNQRLHKEIQQSYESQHKFKGVVTDTTNYEINVYSAEDRLHGAWVGGSMFAQLSTFNSLCISKEEYLEHGPSIVHRKCV